MKEIYSNREDCYLLAKKLIQELKSKINFDGNINQEMLSGTYLLKNDFIRKEIPFYIKFNKNHFLRIQIGTSKDNNDTLEEKLAVLSNFYIILKKDYEEPTVYYTINNDISLQWSFVNKEEDIIKYKNNTYFDNVKTDSVIVIDKDKNEMIGEYHKKRISEKVGLPFELIDLISDNSEEYFKYRNGKEILIDGVPIRSFEKTMKKLIKRF